MVKKQRVAEERVTLFINEIVRVVKELPFSSQKKILHFAQKLVKNKMNKSVKSTDIGE